jgi:hypothetical protein
VSVRNAQERLETTRGGRVALSVAIAALLALMVIENLPDSALRRAADPTAARLLTATGAEQQWGMFAPDPRRVSIVLEARVRFQDGSTTTWRPPAGGALVGSYWDYHWGKLAEHASFDEGRDADKVRDGLARYAARTVAEPGRRPSAVSLVSVRTGEDIHEEVPVYRLEFGALGP